MFNLLLIVIDCLRADHVSAFGYKRQTTPNIDKLVKNSVLFRRAYTQSTYTLTSATSILTGLYPEAHGVLRFRDKISRGFITLPGYLQRHGFETTCFQGMSFFSPPWGLAGVGFNKVNFLEQERAKRKHRQATCDEIYSKFSSYIEEVDPPFFSLIWFFDLHGAYGRFLMPEKNMYYLGKSGNAVVDGYDSELKFVDYYIGRIMQALNKKGLMDDTLVIITADHGEIFDEHYLSEGNSIVDILYKLPYFQKELSGNGHLGHLKVPPYEEVIHVPLIMKFPQNKYKCETESQVELIDIFPTILDLLNTKTENVLQGRSVIPLLENNLNGKIVVYCCTEPANSIGLYACAKDDKFKFIKFYASMRARARNIINFREDPKRFIAWRVMARGERFFKTDVSEKVDVSKQYPEHRHFLKKKLLQWRKKNKMLREKIRIRNVIRRLRTHRKY